MADLCGHREFKTERCWGMNAMTEIKHQHLQWYAVKTKQPANANRRTTVLGASYETYTSRSGFKCRRRVSGTGQRVFVPELILQRAGFEVFLPVKKVWRWKNNRRKEKYLATLPLMHNWLFVG